MDLQVEGIWGTGYNIPQSHILSALRGTVGFRVKGLGV